MRSGTFPSLGSTKFSVACTALRPLCKPQCYLIACAAICCVLNALAGTEATHADGNGIFCSLVVRMLAGKQQECLCGVCAKELKLPMLLDSSSHAEA